MINLILDYWYFAALFVAGWAFWKAFKTPSHSNTLNVNGDRNNVLQIGGTSKDLEKQATELLKEYKSNLQ